MRLFSKNSLLILSFFALILGAAAGVTAQTNISNSPNWFSTCPRLAVDSAGNVHAIWVEFYTMNGYYPSSGDAFYAKYTTATKQWSAPVNLSNSRQCYSGEWYCVGIDADGVGNVYAVYVDGPKLKLRILSGGTWGSPFEVGSAGTADIDSARVAATSSGDIFVVWCYGLNVYSRARVGGVWEGVVSLKDPASTHAKFPEISVGTNRVYCVFMDNHYTPTFYTAVYVTRPRTYGAAWSRSYRMTNMNTWEEHPAVRVDANDVAHVVFTPYYDSSASRDVRYVEGTYNGFGSPVLLGTIGNVHYPSLAVRGTNVYACWQSVGVHYRNRIGGTWGAEAAVPGLSCFGMTDVAVSASQDKIFYATDTGAGDIYFTEMAGSGPSVPTPGPIIIDGTVRTPTGNAVANVKMSGLPISPLTNSAGTYQDGVANGFTGTVTPGLSGYTFSPSSRNYSGVIANQVDQDYTASTNGCAYSVTPTLHLFTDSGGTGSVSVTSSGGCAWSASSLNGWITITSGSSGSGNGTVQFTVGNNAGAPTRTGTLVVAGRTVTVHQEGQILFNASFGYVVLPECIWAPATGGGTWATEVQVTDVTGGSQVSAYFSYGGGARRGPVTVWNNSGADKRSVKFSNFLAQLASIDTGFTYSGKVGAVEFLTQDAAHRIQVAARTLNGSYSKTLPGLVPGDPNTAEVSRPMMIQNFTNNSAFRSTCGFFNPTPTSVTAEFRLYGANGALIGSAFSKSFVGYDFKAFSPFTEAGVPYPTYAHDNAYLVVNPTSGSGRLVCFGASASNSSNDPAAHIAVQYGGAYDNSPADITVLPECIWAAASGGGTWLTEVQVTDLTGGSAVSAYFDYGGGLRRGPIALWTNTGGAGRSLKLSNILSSLASLDSGFTYSGRVGAVELATQDAAHKIQAAARTLNGSLSSKTLPGLRVVDSNTASTARQMIIENLTNNSTYRSTCGFFNPTADSVGVEFRLYNSSGVTIGGAFTKSFGGYDFKTFNPFTEAGVPYPGASYDNVILIVKPTAGAGKLICFGASANNSSNDPAAHIALQYN